jgi:hypothetical protein
LDDFEAGLVMWLKSLCGQIGVDTLHQADHRVSPSSQVRAELFNE